MFWAAKMLMYSRRLDSARDRMHLVSHEMEGSKKTITLAQNHITCATVYASKSGVFVCGACVHIVCCVATLHGGCVLRPVQPVSHVFVGSLTLIMGPQ